MVQHRSARLACPTLRSSSRMRSYVSPSASVTLGAGQPRSRTCLANSEYQARSAKLITVLNDLRKVGAQGHIEIPTVVVCGDQSSGKSSIIQRICGVDLPRSHGTCTRCPMELRLVQHPFAPAGGGNDGSGSPSWTCELKIIREHRVGETQDLTSLREESFGPQITDKADVELWVRKAQLAILNPGTPTTTFTDPNLEWHESKANELKFSKCLVILEVKGAPVNLTLVDLPGIIRSADNKEDTHYVGLIRQLTIDCIGKPQSIIVLAVAMNNDVENQEVYSLAKEADPESRRTLGVLTKPDLVEPGCGDGWLAVLQGQRYSLALGWHAVKNPTKLQLDARISHEEATYDEEGFFSSNALWAAVSSLERVGINCLMQAISAQLTQALAKNLPEMKNMVEALVKQTRQDLEALPPVVEPAERHRHLSQLVRGLCHDVADVMAERKDSSFDKRLLRFFEEFSGAVLDSRPHFELRPAATHHKEGHWNDKTDAEKRKEPAVIADYSDDKDMPVIVKDVDSCKLDRMLTKHDLKDMIKREAALYYTLNTRPYKAFVNAVQHFQGGWDRPAMICLEHAVELLHEVCSEKVMQRFSRFEQLENYMQSCALTIAEIREQTCRQRISELLCMEAVDPFTLNGTYYKDSRKTFQDALRTAMHETEQPKECREPFEKAMRLTKALSSLADLGYQGLTVKQLEQRLLLLPEPGDEEAAELMASTMAYFKVSSKRFRDMVPKFIMHHLLYDFGNDLEDHILASIHESSHMTPQGADEDSASNGLLSSRTDGAGGSGSGVQRRTDPSGYHGSRVVDLMVDDPAVARRREKLSIKVKDLHAVQKVLARI